MYILCKARKYVYVEDDKFRYKVTELHGIELFIKDITLIEFQD